MTATAGPLDGLRVIELGHIMAGPVCGLMLADMGADVIKVERVPDGDPTRGFRPPDIGGESAAFMMLNRNKRGVAVDVKSNRGLQVVRRLIKGADVVIENFRLGTMDRLGLGYDTLREDNPGLIYCELSGFGRTGPFANLAGFDLIAQGYSGLMSITGEGPDRPPVKCGAPVTDITAGILGAMGVLAAYIQALRSGEGQRVDTSLFEAGIVQTYWQAAITLASGLAPGPMGSVHPLSAPYRSFRTSDGWINVGASSQSSWEKLPPAVGLPELLDDPRFTRNADRMTNRVALEAALQDAFEECPTADWLARLEAAGVPAGPVLDVAEMLEHPQTRARDMVTSVQHARLGAVNTIGLPLKFSNTAGSLRLGAPLLGEHTVEVLRAVGYDDGEIQALLASGAVLASDAG